MAFVTAGNPRESYLMRKMDGSQCVLDAQCTGGSCNSMPKNAERSSARGRNARHCPPLGWIAQGAKND